MTIRCIRRAENRSKTNRELYKTLKRCWAQHTILRTKYGLSHLNRVIIGAYDLVSKSKIDVDRIIPILESLILVRGSDDVLVFIQKNRGYIRQQFAEIALAATQSKLART